MDIVMGKPCQGMDCPIGLAISRAAPGRHFSVGCGTVAFYDRPMWPSGWAMVQLPGVADEWARRFDRGDDVQPFSFTMEVPE